METTQGMPNDPSAQENPDGGVVDTSAGVASPQVDTSAVPSDVGGEQGAVEPVQATPEDVQRQEQSERDRERAKWQAEVYARDQQIRQMQEMQMQYLRQQQPQVQSNPYDMQTQFQDWQRFEMQNYGKQIAEETDKRFEQRLQTMLQQANETAWINQHQSEMARAGITVDHIKNFNRMNGIQEWALDSGWKLMNMSSMVANVARQTQQQTINNIRQPQTGASPIRGTSPASVNTPKWSYEVDAKEYADNNWNYPKSWTPERIQAFEMETDGRRFNTQARGDRNV